MEKHIKKFTEFFYKLGELCFQIYMVERPLNLFDFTTEENQVINHAYFEEIQRKYPGTVKGFYMALKKRGEVIHFYLTKEGKVIVEYGKSHDDDVIKVATYESVLKASEDKPAFIHFLTKDWNPLKS